MISVVTPSIRCDGLIPVQESLAKQTFQDFEWLTEIGIPERGHDLNAAFNRMLRRAKGELIVFYEDWAKVEPDFLEKAWDLYKKNPNTLFTCPLGKTLDWKEVKYDFRNFAETIEWDMWEIDLAFAPLKILKEVGGFDEELDKYWSFDNVNLAYRVLLTGKYNFAIAHELKGMVYDHDKMTIHPFRERFYPPFHNERLDAFKNGLKLQYLC